MMIRGLGTLINALAIVAAGVIGVVFRKYIKQSYQETIIKAAGLAVMFMGAADTLSHMTVMGTQGSI